MAIVQSLQTEQVFSIIADEIGVSRDEIGGDVDFLDLGLDNILAKSILARIFEEIKLQLPATTFSNYSTADSLHLHLQKSSNGLPKAANRLVNASPPTTNNSLLSLVLQGKMATATKTLFLLPDGSGSAMAYMMLPQIDPNVCLIGLHSPYLNSSRDQSFTVEDLSATWAEEIMRRQPEGPYSIGGWSAGGYYSFEVAKYLIRHGQKVDTLVLIDSPCRLVYEALPMEVVQYLSTNNLMGNWGTKQPPAWMVNHFDMSLRAISKYTPDPMLRGEVPKVHIIWAEDGVLRSTTPAETGLNLDVKITRMMMQRTDGYGVLGWDKLFPGAKISIATMPGNHFTMVHPPNCNSLSLLLRDSIQDDPRYRRGMWNEE